MSRRGGNLKKRAHLALSNRGRTTGTGYPVLLRASDQIGYANKYWALRQSGGAKPGSDVMVERINDRVPAPPP
jgi:hypothetical protein